MHRTKRIIAVFGGRGASHDDRVKAEALGRVIADRNILLSGGTGPARKPVKNRAIQGAHPSAWIGVDRTKSGGATFKPYEHGRPGVVLTSNLDEVRNYLEALMSDGAIALTGGDGTRSEITSALSLQRPVALVGSHWKQLCDELSRDPATALEGLLDASCKIFGSSEGENHALDGCVTRQALSDGLGKGLNYRCFDAGTPASDVVKWIEDQLPVGPRFPGTFPVGVHNNVAHDYRRWLEDHAV